MEILILSSLQYFPVAYDHVLISEILSSRFLPLMVLVCLSWYFRMPLWIYRVGSSLCLYCRDNLDLKKLINLNWSAFYRQIELTLTDSSTFTPLKMCCAIEFYCCIYNCNTITFVVILFSVTA